MGTREIRIPADAGIAGSSFRNGEASLVEDAYDEIWARYLAQTGA